MIAKPPAKTPDAPPEKSAENKLMGDRPMEKKFDPFHPEMPTIPGVSQGSRPAGQGHGGIDTQQLLRIGGIAAAVVLIGAGIFWWARNRTRGAAASSPDADIAEQGVPAPAPSNPIAPVHEGPTVAATVEQLSKPWAAKKFTFVNPLTQENIDAMVIRLPGGELWGFALKGPFGNCQLEFVTNLGRIASEFKYNASHPMVVNPCDNTVYDPLKVGPLGGNTWARGEIVHGSSLRPPISIDVKVSGRSVIADSIE